MAPSRSRELYPDNIVFVRNTGDIFLREDGEDALLCRLHRARPVSSRAEQPDLVALTFTAVVVLGQAWISALSVLSVCTTNDLTVVNEKAV